MKIVNLISKVSLALAIAALLVPMSSCRKNLLNQESTTDLPANSFWKTEADATYALMGAYASTRPCFDRDYHFDGQGEYVRSRSGTNSATSGNLRLGDAYHNANYNPTGYGGAFDKMYRYLYGAVNRANYVIDGVSKMLPEASSGSVSKLEVIIGEARLLRGLAYFRLISMWGDVPYFSKVIYDNSEVSTLPRLAIGQVKDSIMADFTYAFEKLPTTGSALGRAGKPAALSTPGKASIVLGELEKFWMARIGGVHRKSG